MRRAARLILSIILLITCYSCFVDVEREGHGDRDRGGYHDREGGERGDRDRGGY